MNQVARIALGTSLALLTPILFAGVMTPMYFAFTVLLGIVPSVILAALLLLLHLMLPYRRGFAWPFPMLGFICASIGLYVELQHHDAGSPQESLFFAFFWGVGGAIAGWLFVLCTRRLSGAFLMGNDHDQGDA